MLNIRNLAKVWSSEYLEIDLEEHFISYLENVKSLKSVILAANFYDGITTDLVKRRELYKHFKKRDEPVIQNNIDPILQQTKVGSSADSKKESFNFNNKKILTDFDEFYYDDEQFEIQHKLNKEKNEKVKESFNNISSSGTRRSLRNTTTSANPSYNNINISITNTRETRQKV